MDYDVLLWCMMHLFSWVEFYAYSITLVCEYERRRKSSFFFWSWWDHVECDMITLWTTRQSRNIISLWWLVVETSFREVVWEVLSMLCFMFVKDVIIMVDHLRLWGRHGSLCDILMNSCCLIYYRPIPLMKKPTQTKWQSRWGKVLKESVLRDWIWGMDN